MGKLVESGRKKRRQRQVEQEPKEISRTLLSFNSQRT